MFILKKAIDLFNKTSRTDENLSICVLTPWRQIRPVCFINNRPFSNLLSRVVSEREREKNISRLQSLKKFACMGDMVMFV